VLGARGWNAGGLSSNRSLARNHREVEDNLAGTRERRRWEVPGPGFAGDLEMETLLTAFGSWNFLHACYGEFGQGPIPVANESNFCTGSGLHDMAQPDVYNMVVLHLTQVKSGWRGTDNWSDTIVTDLTNAADDFNLSWTPPHSINDPCGGCNNN